jgi:hypothetical protein
MINFFAQFSFILNQKKPLFADFFGENTFKNHNIGPGCRTLIKLNQLTGLAAMVAGIVRCFKSLYIFIFKKQTNQSHVCMYL